MNSHKIKKFFKILLLLISWAIFPPLFLLSFFLNKNLEKSKRRWAYFSVIFSPFTLILTALIVYLSLAYLPQSFSIDTMEESLNIKLIGDYHVEKNDLIRNGRQDYHAKILIKLTDESFVNLVNQIEKSPFYNLKQDFYGNDEENWKKSDTLTYWKVRKYLEKRKLTGYRVKQDNSTLNFYEPLLSDIPNSSLLFDEAYKIEAWLSMKDKLLTFVYVKY
ncbi:hypothetical protein [Aquirufa nivalisilvae]